MSKYMNLNVSCPGYEGYLNDQVAVLPEILQDAGYYTIMSGKWHLGLTMDGTPYARGFDRFTFPEDFYSSDYYTTRLIDFLKGHKTDAKKSDAPFFAFLPFTAPHWPLQAPAEVVKQYNGIYDEGPDVLREKRLENQVKLGLLPADVEPHPVVAETKEWLEMQQDERKWSAKTMEVFAMVDRMDYNIGRVIKYLEETGEIDNTFILFMSDNGAEGAVREAIPMTGEVIKKSIHKHYNNDLEKLGNGDSFVWYGPPWARASTAPSAMHKGYVTEGGIRCPAIIHYPELSTNTARITRAFTTVMDILPTILDSAGVPQPNGKFCGREVVPIKGKSWIPHLLGKAAKVHDEETVTGWELFFNQAVRKGKYKAVFTPKPKGPEKWQLFDLEKDMGEVHGLASEKPEVLDELVKHWIIYVVEFGVFLKEDLEPNYVLPKQ
ncbi:hypothetical protein OIDMADRAFT_39394 [Oidiodendron maius Zn]|uniref:Sulfatase N-terminal domain-containing protein n=1 Tax=Oidiodendron maius (strain Zn) TaxID=913774 RepID=A0A0C3DS98_OIDMZ|nr:hypothetical protein OIDMADRAFT_39394 [Oidiodendron maius Zn]